MGVSKCSDLSVACWRFTWTPCYTTWGQQARCRVPEYASTVSMVRSILVSAWPEARAITTWLWAAPTGEKKYCSFHSWRINANMGSHVHNMILCKHKLYSSALCLFNLPVLCLYQLRVRGNHASWHWAGLRQMCKAWGSGSVQTPPTRHTTDVRRCRNGIHTSTTEWMNRYAIQSSWRRSHIIFPLTISFDGMIFVVFFRQITNMIYLIRRR